MPIVEAAVKTLGTSGNSQVVGPLDADESPRRHYKDKKLAEGKASLLSYLEKMEDNSVRYGGDYSLYFRKQNIATIAGEFAKAGQLADTWEMLGRFADAPSSKDYGIDPNLGSTLTRALKMPRRPAGDRAIRAAQDLVAADRRPQVGPRPRLVRPRGQGDPASVRPDASRRPGRGRRDTELADRRRSPGRQAR